MSGPYADSAEPPDPVPDAIPAICACGAQGTYGELKAHRKAVWEAIIDEAIPPGVSAVEGRKIVAAAPGSAMAAVGRKLLDALIEHAILVHAGDGGVIR